MSASTALRVRVLVEVESSCPRCSKRLQMKRQLTEEQLTTGNTTEMAMYHLREMKATIQASKDGRGWTAEMCGACRDSDPPDAISFAYDNQDVVDADIERERKILDDEDLRSLEPKQTRLPFSR